MKKTLLILAPLSMLALAACNKSETPAAEGDATAEAPAAPAAPMPPAITAQATYRCADNTILYVEFLGANEAADIRVGAKDAAAVRVNAAKPVADAAAPADPAAAKPTAALKSDDGKTMLTGSGASINVKLADKGGQTCKSS